MQQCVQGKDSKWIASLEMDQKVGSIDTGNWINGYNLDCSRNFWSHMFQSTLEDF